MRNSEVLDLIIIRYDYYHRTFTFALSQDANHVNLHINDTDSPSAKSTEIPTNEKTATKNKELDEFAKALCIAIAYAANAGGVGTLTGTLPNAVLKGQIDE